MRKLPLLRKLTPAPCPKEMPFYFLRQVNCGGTPRKIKKHFFTPIAFLAFALNLPAQAENFQENIQEKLNDRILQQPFDVPDEAAHREMLDEATEEAKPARSKTKDRYYRYWFNGYYYPYPNSYYGFPTFRPKLGL